ncbi:hypothetical protein BHE74_00045097 [Ensete ventricosum]|nr:hypothetical protein BHE74_00045097 [Ensete ventricosum]
MKWTCYVQLNTTVAKTVKSTLAMEQPPHPSQPVTGIVSGAAQIAYGAPTCQPAAVVIGAQEENAAEK